VPAFGAKDKAQSRKQLLIIVIIINYPLLIINCLLYFCPMETNRQKKIGGVIQKDLVDILQGEVRKNGISNLIISVSKVTVTTDLSVATVHLSIFPQDKAKETLAAIKTNSILIKHDLSQRVRLQLRKVPNLTFFIDDSLDYIEKIDNALASKENPIENRDLLERRRKS
jgi:ribosome-binding factor A